jgi:two-component system, LytTR family, response regulator
MSPELRVLVVDDERLARLDLVTMLQRAGGVTVVAEAADLVSAREAARALTPDAVFLDVQLGADNGFDLIEDLPGACRVVLVTAFDSYAIRAFDTNALDYLLKPVRSERLLQSLERVRHRTRAAVATTRLAYDERLFVRTGTARGFVPLTNVRCLIADGDYTRLIVSAGRESLLSRSLSHWEQRLPEQKFVRIHRSSIVNLDHVLRVGDGTTGAHRVWVRDLADPLTMSRRATRRLRAYLR